MQIKVLKTHQTDGVWHHAGSEVETDDGRAKEMILTGLATAVLLDVAKKTEAKPQLSNQNKAAKPPKAKEQAQAEPETSAKPASQTDDPATPPAGDTPETKSSE